MVLSRAIAIFFIAVILVILVAGVIEGDLFDPELLQSNDISEGYLVLGIYQDYRDGGLVTCYHDISVCIFSR